MTTIFETCHKAGCVKLGIVRLVLTDATGVAEWACCWEHAKAFQDWAERESTRQGGWLTAVFYEKDNPWAQ